MQEKARKGIGLLEKVIRFYQKSLDDAETALSYLREKHIHPLIEPFSIGYSSGKLQNVLPSDEELISELKELGILDQTGSERLCGAVTFPVGDIEGAVTGLTGIKDDKAVFVGKSPHIWNAPGLTRSERVVISDNIPDAMSIYLAEYPSVCIYPEDIESSLDILKTSRNLKEILVVSSSGIDGYFQLIAGSGIKSTLVELEGSPNQIFVQGGEDVLRETIKQALVNSGGRNRKSPGIEDIENGFKAVISNRAYEVRSIDRNDRKLKASVRVEYKGRIHVDTVDLYSARNRRQLAMDISRFLEEPSVKIDSDISRLIKYCEEYSQKDERNPGTPTVVLTEEEATAGRVFGEQEGILERILTDYEEYGLIGEKNNKLLCYIAAVSRKMEDPLSVLILSSSGAGKSALQDATLFFTPPEDVIKLTSITGKALFYKGKNSIKHKLLAIEEEMGAEEASYAIRNLISAKELIIEVTVKDYSTGKMTTAQNRVEGPTAVFITTTNPDTDPETRSRFFVTNVDESREQTRKILEYQRKMQSLSYQIERDQLMQTARKHWAFQRQLKEVLVVNPYADKLVFNDDRLQGRRDQPKYLALIKAVAFLRQMQKKIKRHDGREYIEVDRKDLDTAGELAVWLMGRNIDDLNSVSRDLLFQIDRMLEDRIEEIRSDGKEKVPLKNDLQFTRRQIREYSGWAHTRVRRYIDQLVEMEYLVAESGRFGAAYRYRLLFDISNTATPGHRLVTTWSV